MKLVLDEWIVREVIDTLYMARTTFLGITGLDSPQDVEKKSANETAITRRISKAIDIIQQSEQPPLPEGLEEAAWQYAQNEFPDEPRDNEYSRRIVTDAFKAGAKWQAEQGESFVSKVLVNGMNESYVDGYYLNEKIPEGTDVIVQIRRKI